MKQGESEKHLLIKMDGGLIEGIGIKKSLHSQMDFARKTLNPRSRVGEPGPAKKEKRGIPAAGRRRK